MKLIEALQILKKSPPGQPPFTVFLACGFEPLHLETFLAAHLTAAFRGRRIVIRAGVYGDLVGNLARLSETPADAAAVVVEWPDLDPRLGLRGLGGWSYGKLPEILETARLRLAQTQEGLEAARPQMPLAVCFPTLPLPPLDHTAGWQAGAFTLELRKLADALAAQCAGKANLRIVHPARLDRLSPLGERLDVRAELRSGFPYSLSHASAVAEALARLIQPPLPKKGLITDLDDTLWRGILGEVGVEGISWDLDHHSHMHALYQQLLRALAEAGVLVAAATKNDPGLADQALRREDLLLPKDRVFPVVAGWGRKSESVTSILKTWNVGADSVVFVDDSAMELAEVRAVHPEVECVEFPAEDDAAIYALLERLRDTFGKETLTEEDAIRLDSLRSASALRESVEGQGVSLDQFLEQAEAEMTLDFRKEPPDPRALELLNKTNQFNLNGVRFTEAEWSARLKQPETFLVVADYRDKYGPLGKIAVLTGRQEGKTLRVEAWAMSCRAFARRIEHACLAHLFQEFQPDEVVFGFKTTPRNGPLAAFLEELLGQAPEPGVRLSRADFTAKCPPLSHTLRELMHG
jgi:FkbH-like protein